MVSDFGLQIGGPRHVLNVSNRTASTQGGDTSTNPRDRGRKMVSVLRHADGFHGRRRFGQARFRQTQTREITR